MHIKADATFFKKSLKGLPTKELLVLASEVRSALGNFPETRPYANSLHDHLQDILDLFRHYRGTEDKDYYRGVRVVLDRYVGKELKYVFFAAIFAYELNLGHFYVKGMEGRAGKLIGEWDVEKIKRVMKSVEKAKQQAFTAIIGISEESMKLLAEVIWKTMSPYEPPRDDMRGVILVRAPGSPEKEVRKIYIPVELSFHQTSGIEGELRHLALDGNAIFKQRILPLINEKSRSVVSVPERPITIPEIKSSPLVRKKDIPRMIDEDMFLQRLLREDIEEKFIIASIEEEIACVINSHMNRIWAGENTKPLSFNDMYRKLLENELDEAWKHALDIR